MTIRTDVLRADILITAEQLAERVEAGESITILDVRWQLDRPDGFARAHDRPGAAEPVDPVAGHIPGARTLPSGSLLDDAGFFRPAAELEQRFGAVGAADASVVGVYCGSGVTAAVDIAALAVLGIGAALFPGSWSQWSANPALPVATGSSTARGEDDSRS
ncbi:sulfurtransferase [Nocardia sp. NPDC059246]|uniref:sulfurtransferase n=1 Tax=unclassified Nocardia TaxID=2637762 RepID=UPI0036AC9CE3